MTAIVAPPIVYCYPLVATKLELSPVEEHLLELLFGIGGCTHFDKFLGFNVQSALHEV